MLRSARFFLVLLQYLILGVIVILARIDKSNG